MKQKKADNYISEEKKRELEAELEFLRGSERKKILEALAYAKSLGDLSENAEYHQAREDQGKLEERIRRIEAILLSSQVIAKKSGDTVDVGSTVVVRKYGEEEERSYQIVGSEEADMALGRISNVSPLGSALLGKKKGTRVVLETPGGGVKYDILDVR